MKLRHKLILDYYVGGMLHVLLKFPTMLLGWLLRRGHDLGSRDEVVFLKLLGGGSLVIAYPSLLALKQAGRRLTLVTTAGIKPFAELLGVFDEIHVIHENSAWGLAKDAIAAIRKVRRCPILVDLEVHSRLSTVFCLLTCARNRISFYSVTAFWRRNLATHLLYFNQHAPVYLLYDQVSGLLGSRALEFPVAQATFRGHLESVRRSEIAIPSDMEHIGIAATCSDLGRERMLRNEEWAEIVKTRVADPARACIHLLGSAADRPYLVQLASALQDALPELRVKNHGGEMGLEESVRLISKLDRLLAIDSSLLHFARLLEVPAESWWGPTDPALRLRDLRPGEAHYRPLSCSPCIHVTGEVPCSGNNRCMRASVTPMDQAIDGNPIWLVTPDGSVVEHGRAEPTSGSNRT